MKTRFDLEEEIMKLYSFAEDLETISNLIMESLEVSSEVQDKSVNVLIGIETMLKIHADKMMDTMAQCFKLIPYNDDTTSTLSVEVPLTDADNRVITKCSGKCHTRTSSECSGKYHSTMSSFEYQ
jgi:hypothetical protein